MLTFLLNDTAWPSDARSFKYTNLMLHLLNAMLLYTLAYRLLLCIKYSPDQSLSLALLTSGIWLLHPLNVSTVLYPVQRMAILATLFVLVGLVGYVYARLKLQSQPRTAYLFMSLSLGMGSLLAVFSKENGALLPLLAWVIEFTILSRNNNSVPNKYWQAVFFWSPAALLLGYFLYLLLFGNLVSAYVSRDFTLIERLLTEPRILFDYLYYWFIPQSNSPGLLTQDFPVSKDLFNPLTTIVAIAGLLVIIMLAFRLRKFHPLITLASLFYFTGHLLESTLLPLELYFEHRNYLPAIFLALPLATTISVLPIQHKYRVLLAIILLLAPTLATIKRASYWENLEALAYHWAEAHPSSQRAQRHAALVAANHNKPDLSLSIMHQARLRHPDRIATHLHWLTLKCRFIPVSSDQKLDTLKTLKHGKFSFRNTALLRSSLNFIASSECHNGGLYFAYDMLDALAENSTAKQTAGARHQLHHIRGTFLLAEKKYTRASEEFRLSLMQVARAETGMLQASLLASAHQFNMALKHLEYIKNTTDLSQKSGMINYKEELERLRIIIQDDINATRSPIH